MKQIPNCPKYQIDTKGKVQNIKSGRILKTHVDRRGYEVIKLMTSDAMPLRKNAKVHRLVAHVYLPNTRGKIDVNHINGNKLDNRVENLEWVTRRENIIHSHKIGKTSKDREIKMLREEVKQLKLILKELENV